MSRTDFSPSRRRVLQGVGGAVVGSGAGLGSAGGTSDRIRVNVGYGAAAGRDAALAEATDVKYDYAFDAVTVRVPEVAAEALARRPDVRYVERDGQYRALAQTRSWGVDRVDAPAAHAEGDTGSGADVAIIDTGIDADHPDLAGHLGDGTAYVNCASGCDTVWDDDHDHGTHCAGIAGAIDNSRGVLGVAPDVTLHAVKVLDSAGIGTWSDIASGIEFVGFQSGWDVGSMSLGGSSASSVVKDAVEFTSGEGKLLVAAAGNTDGGSLSYPAAYPEVMAVSATDSNDNLASFSATGSGIEIAAPGQNILSTVPGGTATFSGTSMACPHVAGAAALLMDDGFSNGGARSHLKATAENVGLSSNESGSGLLDVEVALTDPGVVTESATNVTSFSATLNGRVDHLGNAGSVDVHFEWKHESDSTYNTTATQTLTSPGSFSEDLSGLQCGTYTYRAVADASDGDSRTGGLLGFITELCDDPGGGCDDGRIIC